MTQGVDGLLVVVRWLHFGSMMLVFGWSAFCLYASEALPLSDYRGSLLAAAAVTLVSALVWLGCLAAEYADDASAAALGTALRLVLFDTSFGVPWSLHIGLAVVVLAAAWLRAGLVSMLVTSGAVLASQAWIGHAAAGAGFPRTLHLGAQIAHLLAAGLWLGGLPALWLVVRRACFQHDASGFESVAPRALVRFSTVGLITVPVLIITGAANTSFLISWPPDPHNSYVEVLAIKLGVFLAMLGVATFNRTYLLPRLWHDAATLRSFEISIATEQFLGACALGAASVLGVTAPT